MLLKLLKYFTDAVDNDAYMDDSILILNLSSNYGSINLSCDDKNNKFVVEGSVDTDQYSALFMINEEDIDKSDLDDWNTVDTYTNINKALERCQEILDAYESESDGIDVFDLDNPAFFTDAIKVIK